MPIQGLPGQPRGLVAQAYGLQVDRRENAPISLRSNYFCQPLGVCEVAAQPHPDGLDPLQPEMEPQLQGPEAAPQRDPPVLVLHDIVIGARAQIGGSARHAGHEVIDIADIEQRAVEDGPEPLVRVPHDRVGAVDAGEEVAHLGQDHRGARHRRVDVHPRAMPGGDLDDLGHGVEGGGAGRAEGRDHGRGPAPGGDIRRHRRLEGIGFHRIGHRIDLDIAQVVPPETGEQDRLGHRGMRVLGGVDNERSLDALQTARVLREAAGALAGREHGHERPRGGGVLDRAPPGRIETGQLAQPLGHDLLDLGQCRRGQPGDAEGREAAGGDIAEQRGEGGIARKPAKKGRMLGLGDAGHNDLLEIAQHRGEFLRCLRRAARKGLPDLTRTDLGSNGQAGDALAMIGDPVDESVTGGAELLGRHTGHSHRTATRRVG